MKGFRRIAICLTQDQYNFLNKRAQKVGISKASIIRLLLDEMIRRERDEDKTS